MKVRFLVIYFIAIMTLTANLLGNPSPTNAAATCAVAKIEPDAGGQNWDLTYCMTADTEAEARSVQTITATCRAAPGGTFNNSSCHEDWQDITYLGTESVSQSKTISVKDVVKDTNGTYLTCFTLTSLDRNMGTIEVNFEDSAGNEVCPTQRTPVTPANYGLLEYFQNALANLTGLVPTFAAGGATTDLYCSSLTVTKGINTALGCIDTDMTSGGFLRTLLTVSVGVGGGIALLLMLYGTFIVTTSAGIPDKLTQGKEIITSAAIGLIFIVLSVVLMNLIGVNILGIPGLV